MTYALGSVPPNLSTYHRNELERARGYLEFIAKIHPEWIVRKVLR